MLSLDFYWFSRLKIIFNKKFTKNTFKNEIFKNTIFYGFWILSFLMIGFSLFYRLGNPYILPATLRNVLTNTIIAVYLTKFFTTLFFLVEDFIIFIKYCYYFVLNFFKNKPKTEQSESTGQSEKTPTFTRSEFLTKGIFLASSIPLGLLSYGMAWGATDFQVRNVRVPIRNLSQKWRGLRIAHISDLHVGSYYDDKAIRRGIELLKSQKPDIICFTGDLVNQYTDEIKPFFSALLQLKAPFGVVSSLGNHDYGDYYQWDSVKAKSENLQKMYLAHKQLGWKLLVDDVFFLEENNEKLTFLGVGNWSASSRFPQYGNLSKTYEKIESQAQNKILLSHDPSHWDAQVRNYADIDLTLSGHTHGMQIGIEVGNFKWSPSQYMYEQWAGLYEKNGQKIYVNRGFGYSQVMPARIGILPEITILTLENV